MRLQNELKTARSNSMELSPEQILRSMEEKAQVYKLIARELNWVSLFLFFLKKMKKKNILLPGT